MANLYAYRIDNHGDSIRPQSIQDARAKVRAKEMSPDELREVEDAAIREWISQQRHLTLSALTDGGYRNGDYRSPFFHSVAGFVRVPDQMLPSGLGTWTVDGPLRVKKPIASDAANFMLEHTGLPVKVNLPSAAHIAAQCYSDVTVRAYPGAAALGDAIADLLREEVEHLFEIGVKFVQLDNPDYSAHLAGRTAGELSFEEALEIDAAAVAGIEKEEDQKVALVVGWGDDLDAPVDASRAERLFGLDYDKFTFPYHSDAAVALDLPRYVPDDKQIGIGIVDATNPVLDDIDPVLARIDRAVELHDYDRIGLLPHRPFMPVHYKPVNLSADEQRRKLELVEIIATMIWGNEA